MTKTARLFFIMDHLRRGRTFSVSDLASICDISQRTVFRDIRDLQKLQVPIYFDDGYRLTPARRRRRPAIDVEGFEILCFALSANPLAGISGFDKKLKSLERKLRDLSDPTGKRSSSHSSRWLKADKQERGCLSARESRMIALLWKRTLETRPVSLTLKLNSSAKSRTICGRAERLVWRAGRWAVCLRRSKPSRLSYHYIDQIISVQIPSDQARAD